MLDTGGVVVDLIITKNFTILVTKKQVTENERKLVFVKMPEGNPNGGAVFNKLIAKFLVHTEDIQDQ